jgi:hypothetical protein
MSKLDTLQLRNDIHYMITKFQAKIELSNFAKNHSLMTKVLNMSETCQNGKPHKLHARTTILIIRLS